MSQTRDHKLLIEGLTVLLPSGRRILDEVSLEVASGETVVILGESGSGKSTLGDVLFGLLASRMPSAQVSAAKICANRHRMAFVLQKGALFDHLGVLDNLRFAARRAGVRPFSREQAGALLASTGFRADHDDTNRLSGGEERRVSVARALATNPELVFFDEPSAGLDLHNVRRVAELVRKTCQEHGAAAVVVTHDPLLAALVGNRLLYLDGANGQVRPLIEDWSGPYSSDNEELLNQGRLLVEGALHDRLLDTNRRRERQSLCANSDFSRALGGFFDAVTTPGRMLKDVLSLIVNLPATLLRPADLLSMTWRALLLTSYSGLFFFVLVGAILSATFLSIAFAAASLVSPTIIVENLRGDFILALTPPLCGFLFAARSGSALTAWLGGMSLRRQSDALRSLGVSVEQYLRLPAFLGTFLGFILASLFFGAAMYLSATLTATSFDVDNAGLTLSLTSPGFQRQFIEKTLLYGTIVGVVGTHMGLKSQLTSQDVAHSITRAIIYCTLAIVLSELFFAVDLHAGG